MLESKLPNITSKATRLQRFEYIDTLSKGLVYNDDAKIAIYNNKAAADVNDTTQAIDVWEAAGKTLTTNSQQAKLQTKAMTLRQLTLQYSLQVLKKSQRNTTMDSTT